ncbi:MAG TPA: carboxylesterase family protein [Streptosporangiaceae bacterium]|nr:carboxylesterase family protein [Streptosporangiaceae bacterium]
MEPLVQTKTGPVRGQIHDGVASFLGIPYAASPTGELRFAAPVPHEPWTDVLDATAFGPTPPKPAYPAPFDRLLEEPSIAGDEWLNLNVWTPSEARGFDSARLPVMVWIHGGAFANGNSAVPWYNGHAFAKAGVVLVSINYRLGVDGFALLPDAPANRGLLDQIAALEWVRDNIGSFGGDPANVTIFGESAGAMSVITLMSLPRAQGLFTKAIAQSGAVQAAADPADAALVTAELGVALRAVLADIGLADMGLADMGLAGADVTAAGLSGVGLDALIAAQAKVRDALGADPNPARFGASVVASSMPFIPVIDGDLIAEHPLTAIAGGAGSTVTLLIGTNAEEFRLFLVPPGTADQITADALPFVAGAIGAGQGVISTYQANRPNASPGDIFAALLTDKFFRLPALAVAQARSGGPAATYFYEFGWGHPPIGAGHSLEIPFVFDNLATAAADLVIGADPPQDLADEMNSTWVRFATTANPGWPAFDGSRPVRIFDADGGSIEHDPRGDERAIWPAG